MLWSQAQGNGEMVHGQRDGHSLASPTGSLPADASPEPPAQSLGQRRGEPSQSGVLWSPVLRPRKACGQGSSWLVSGVPGRAQGVPSEGTQPPVPGASGHTLSCSGQTLPGGLQCPIPTDILPRAGQPIHRGPAWAPGTLHPTPALEEDAAITPLMDGDGRAQSHSKRGAFPSGPNSACDIRGPHGLISVSSKAPTAPECPRSLRLLLRVAEP